MNPISAIAKFLGINRFFLIGGAVLLIVLAGSIWLATHDRAVIKQHYDAANVKVLTTDAAAKETAAVQRANNTAIINQDEKDRNNAITSKPAQMPSAASVRLNCERLRRVGQDTSSLSICN